MASTPILVRDVMVTQVQFVAPDDTLRDAMEVMMEQGLTTLPVVDSQQACVGVIAAVDLLAPSDEMQEELRRITSTSGQEQGYLAEIVPLKGLSIHKVEDFMSSHVISVSADTELRKAAGTMLKNQIHHLVVIDSKGRLIGILSTMDILEVFAAEDGESDAE